MLLKIFLFGLDSQLSQMSIYVPKKTARFLEKVLVLSWTREEKSKHREMFSMRLIYYSLLLLKYR